MKTLIINNHTKYLEQLCSFFENSTVIQREDIRDNFDFKMYDLLVFSGGSNIPTVLRHSEDYITEINIIKKVTIPIIGICLGAEIIVRAFKGELQELPVKLRGIIELKIIDAELKRLNKSDTIKVFEGHHIGIKTVPKYFAISAYSDYGPEIIKHIAKPIFAIQFHPEISKNKSLVKWLLQNN